MATITPTVTYAPDGNRNAVLVSWTLANGDDGSPYKGFGIIDGSVQVQGTFGTGGSVQMEISNDGTNYQLMADPQGTDIVKTSADLETILDIIGRQIRPNCTAGDGTTSIVVTMYGVRR